MAEATNARTVRMLRRTEADVGDLKGDMRGIGQRACSVAPLLLGLSSRLDPRDEIMEPVLRRLDLVDVASTAG